MLSNLRSMSSSMRRMPEPVVAGAAVGGAWLLAPTGPISVVGVTAALGIEDVSRGACIEPSTASAKASKIEAGIADPGLGGGLLRLPAPGSVERRGGGGGRPGTLGRDKDG